MIKMLMNCNPLLYLFNAVCFLVGVELAVSVSIIHFVSFIKQILSWICFNYLCVCVYCILSSNNSHKNENLNHHLPPLSLQTHMNFCQCCFFFFSTIKIDDDVEFGADDKSYTGL